MRVEVGSASWTDLETLLDTTFEEGASYDVQLVEGRQVMIVQGASEPTDSKDGFILEYNQGCTITKESGKNFYVKSFNQGCKLYVAEGGE